MASKPPTRKSGDPQRFFISDRRDEILDELRLGTSIRQTYLKCGDGISGHQQFHKLVTRLWWPEVEAIRKELAAQKKPSSRPVGTQSQPQSNSPALSGSSHESLGLSLYEFDKSQLTTSATNERKQSSSIGRPYIRLGIRTREELLRVSAKGSLSVSKPKINLEVLDD